MIDIREYERKANVLINKCKPMKFRLILSNGNMIERRINPIIVGSKVKCYRDQKILYKPISDAIDNLQTVSINSLRLLQNVENKSIKVDGNPVKHVIIELLKMNYEIIE